MFIKTILFVTCFCLNCHFAKASLIILDSPSEFKSTFDVEDFETGLVNTALSFSGLGRVFIESAASASSGITTSGLFGLVVDSTNPNTLRINFNINVNETGLWFGNDAFGNIFSAYLFAYNEANELLGSASKETNGNDFVDQFIGLRTTQNISYLIFEYPKSESRGLSIFIDDVSYGLIKVSEPNSLLIFAILVAFISRKYRSDVK
jgi:hypothetical protein